MRSNLGVGMPIDILIARRDACDAELNYRIEPGEPYFHDLRERWSAALRAAHIGNPASALQEYPLIAMSIIYRRLTAARRKARVAAEQIGVSISPQAN